MLVEWRVMDMELKNVKNSAAELIGNTPMLYVHKYMKAVNAEDAAILAKLEYFNPAGSVKDSLKILLILLCIERQQDLKYGSRQMERLIFL
jgi:cysteine synthase